jgi:hypothetical protein
MTIRGGPIPPETESALIFLKTVDIPSPICHTDKIKRGRYILDKAHSRSLRKGQGHSNYNLHVCVKQSYMITVHIIHEVVH